CRWTLALAGARVVSHSSPRVSSAAAAGDRNWGRVPRIAAFQADIDLGVFFIGMELFAHLCSAAGPGKAGAGRNGLQSGTFGAGGWCPGLDHVGAALPVHALWRGPGAG